MVTLKIHNYISSSPKKKRKRKENCNDNRVACILTYRNLEGEHEKKKEEIIEDASFSSLLQINNWQNDYTTTQEDIQLLYKR